MITQSESCRFGWSRSVPGSAACWTVRHRLVRHRLAGVTPSAARSFWIGAAAAGCRRPEREVVGEGGHRAHVHEIVAQQAAASTQRLVDLRQEEVAGVHGEPQSLDHVALLETVHRRVVVAADAEYVSVQRIVIVIVKDNVSVYGTVIVAVHCHWDSSPGSSDECSTGRQVAADLWTKPIGLSLRSA